MNESKGTGLSLLVKCKGGLIKIVVIVVVLLIVVLALSLKGYISKTEKYKSIIKELEEENERLSDPIVKYEIASKEVNIELITSEIRDIGELATIEYLYTDAGKFEDPAKVFGKEIPFSFTTKSFIAKWDGIIKIGVNVDEITVEVRDYNKEIVVHIPEAVILSHEIDELPGRKAQAGHRFPDRISKSPWGAGSRSGVLRLPPAVLPRRSCIHPQ